MVDSFELARAIVPLLNQSPFNKQFTLVGFDQLGPQQLLPLLADVLREISTDYNIDARSEPPESVARRVIETLAILGYRLPEDQYAFMDAIAACSRDAIYPILAFLLTNLSKLRVKAYLARFLVPISVPDDVVADEAYATYKAAMDEFREVHRQLTTMRDTSAAIAASKRENQRLSQERATLAEKLDRARRKVGEVPNGAALLGAASGVRTQMDERHRVGETLNEQKERLARAREELLRVQETLKEVRAASSMGPEGFMKQMEEELTTNKYVLARDLPQEIAAMREWKGLLEEVLNEPTVTEASRAMLHQELTQLRSTVKDLNAKRAARQQPSDEQLGMYRQQVAVVERKRDEIVEQLKAAQAELDGVRREHAEHQRQFEAAGGDSRILQGGQLESFVEVVKKKIEEVKSIKAELSDMKAESGVLSRTKDILIAQDPSCPAFVAEFEARGPAEPKPAEEKLEEVSQKKQEIEEAKGKTLQELTKVLAEINLVLQEKRQKLAPLAKELRAARAVFQEIEANHTERKKEYDTLMLQIDNERGKTELETRAYREDWTREETRFHTNHCMLLLLGAQMAKSAEKALPREDGKTYMEVYTAKSKQQGSQAEILRARQLAIKDTAEPNMAQAEMFTGLRSLLSLKLELLRRPKQAESKGIQDAGVDRMIIQ